MTYKLSLYGRGAEFTFGEVTAEMWNYIQNECEGDVDTFIDKWDDGELPDGMGIPEDRSDMYDYDDYGHDHGCYPNWFQLSVTDEDDKEVCTLNENSGIEITREEENISDGIEHCTVWVSEEKGTFFVGEIDIDGEFDPKKLKINVRSYLYNKSTETYDIITSLEYDGEEIYGDFSDTTGKGENIQIV